MSCDPHNTTSAGFAKYPTLVSSPTINAWIDSGRGSDLNYNDKGTVSFATLLKVYGFFMGKRVAYPIVGNYVKNTRSKYGLVKSMMNSSNGLFFFPFSSMDGLNTMLENDPWSSYARAMIELRDDVKLKDTIVVVVPKLVGEDECPKKIILDVLINLKNPRQAVRGVGLSRLNKFTNLSLKRRVLVQV
ncbi:hypothetical protein Tco_1047931, partial [Tanacetum coccineum]